MFPMLTNSGLQLYFSYFLTVLFLTSVFRELLKGKLLIIKLLSISVSHLKARLLFAKSVTFGPLS